MELRNNSVCHGLNVGCMLPFSSLSIVSRPVHRNCFENFRFFMPTLQIFCLHCVYIAYLAFNLESISRRAIKVFAIRINYRGKIKYDLLICSMSLCIILRQFIILEINMFTPGKQLICAGERVCDIAFWKEQLLAEIQLMETECDNLQVHCTIALDIPLTTQLTTDILWTLVEMILIIEINYFSLFLLSPA